MNENQIFKNEMFEKFLDHGRNQVLRDYLKDFGLSQSQKKVNQMHSITAR